MGNAIMLKKPGGSGGNAVIRKGIKTIESATYDYFTVDLTPDEIADTSIIKAVAIRATDEYLGTLQFPTEAGIPVWAFLPLDNLYHRANGYPVPYEYLSNTTGDKAWRLNTSFTDAGRLGIISNYKMQFSMNMAMQPGATYEWYIIKEA